MNTFEKRPPSARSLRTPAIQLGTKRLFLTTSLGF